MSGRWIRARLRGVYSADAEEHRERGRRLAIELDYGTLHDVEPSLPPTAVDAEAGEGEIVFERIDRLRVELPRARGARADSTDDALLHLADRDLTLFDVRLRDFKLLYPASSSRRVFGTIVGELLGCLEEPAPPRAEEVDPARVVGARLGLDGTADDAAASEDGGGGTPGRPAASPVVRRLAPAGPAAWDIGPIGSGPRTGGFDLSSPELDLSRFLGLVVAGAVCGIGLFGAIVHGPEVAAFWLAPILAALGIRALPRSLELGGASAAALLGSGLVALQAGLIVGPLQEVWESAGARVSPLPLGLAALSLLGSAALRPRVWVFAAACVWTIAAGLAGPAALR